MTIGAFTVARHTLWLLSGAAVALVIVLMALIGTAQSASEVPAEVVCEQTEAEFGSLISCTATGPTDSILDWGDGAQLLMGDGLSAEHSPSAVGPVAVTVTSSEGELLATTEVTVHPDLAVTCEYGLPKPVYALAPAIDTTVAPYSYVYLHPDTGEEMYPGDPDYPESVMEMTKLEAQTLGEEPIVGLCSADSAAVAALGGTITWTIDDDWHPARTVIAQRVTPVTQGTWEGVQPIDVAIVAEAHGFEASERIGVYFGGCG